MVLWVNSRRWQPSLSTSVRRRSPKIDSPNHIEDRSRETCFFYCIIFRTWNFVIFSSVLWCCFLQMEENYFRDRSILHIRPTISKHEVAGTNVFNTMCLEACTNSFHFSLSFLMFHLDLKKRLWALGWKITMVLCVKHLRPNTSEKVSFRNILLGREFMILFKNYVYVEALV